METIDDEVLEHALDFIDRQAAADTPFFCWFNTTHMHLRTHPKPESIGQAGRWQSPYHDTMIDHDKVVGALLDKLDELGLAENTIVIYSTDNGPHMNTWPDGGMTPFRSEKNTNWEGAFRVPEMIRWPGKIPAGVGLERDRPAPRLAADLPRRRRRAGHRREAQGGPHDRRHDLQGPHRRLQPAAVPDRRGRQVAAQGPRLLLRRRRRARAALRQLEGRLHGAARARARCRSGPSRSSRCACRSSSTCAPTRSSAPTSRRTRTTTGCSRTTTSSSRPRRWSPQFLADVRGVPAAPEGRELHDRPGRGQARERHHVGPMSLASWNDGAARTAILDFVERVTEEGGADYVPPAERVAVLDNDGTLWCEKPTYIQALFVFARLGEAGRGATRAGRAAGRQGAARRRPRRRAASTASRRSPASCSSSTRASPRRSSTRDAAALARRGRAPALRRAVRAS